MLIPTRRHETRVPGQTGRAIRPWLEASVLCSTSGVSRGFAVAEAVTATRGRTPRSRRTVQLHQ